jgi:hypothetical protein
MGHIGSIFDITGQLAAGSIDVVTTSFAYRGDKTRLNQGFCKLGHSSIVRPQQTRFFERVERDQVEFTAKALGRMSPDQLDQLLCVLGLIVDTLQHAIFEGDEVARCLA